MKTLILLIALQLTGCAALSTSALLADLRKSGCELKSVELQGKDKIITCHGFNPMMYQTEQGK